LEILESRAIVDPILKEGLMNMEKCNKISSGLLMQYKEHIIQLTNQNATLNKKLKSLSGIEQKYDEVVQQNELYETDLKELEETVKMIESQVDREQ
jgi:polyhydroxyalkanoate synthesis regulator phasin